jgi:hypothetical protein
MQLKENGEWFAPNMAKQFPSLAARYLYTDDDKGTDGEWILDSIRESKTNVKTGTIPCKYDWNTRLLVPKSN